MVAHSRFDGVTVSDGAEERAPRTKCASSRGGLGRFEWRLCLAVLLVPSMSCSILTDPTDATRLYVNATNLVLLVGERTMLESSLARGGLVYNSSTTGFARRFPPDVRMAWFSASPQIAGVDSGGNVTARASGRAMIRAEAAGVSDSVTVTVHDPSAGAQRFSSISAGGSHTCALGHDRAAYCWGSAWFGQIGGGTVRRYTATVAPARVLVPFILVAVSAGSYHSCAVDERGAVWCWGDGAFGQLGPGRASQPPTPAVVSLRELAVDVSAGGDHTCALARSGVVACWGRGRNAQLWLRPNVGRFTSISSGHNHSCALDEEGRAFCWGNNDTGQLGVGDRQSRVAPVLVAGNERLTSISAGVRYTCGVTIIGAALCWGHGDGGLLGTGDGASSLTPVPVSGGLTFARVDAGTRHTCGIATSGAGFCWGFDDRGQLGDGPFAIPDPRLTDLIHLAPVRVRSDVSFSSVTAGGGEQTCALTQTSVAYCWGNNTAGALGIGRMDLAAGLEFSMQDLPTVLRSR